MPEPLWGSGIDSTHGAGVGSMHLGGDEASNAVQSMLLLRACCTSTAQSFGKPAGIWPVHFAPIAAAAGRAASPDKRRCLLLAAPRLRTPRGYHSAPAAKAAARGNPTAIG